MLTQEWDMEKALDTRYFEGEVSGIKKGVDKGIEQEKASTIRHMRSIGLSTEDIVKFTGYPIESVKRLRQ